MSTDADRTPTDQKIFDATPTGQTLVKETSVIVDDDLLDAGPPTIKRIDRPDTTPTDQKIVVDVTPTDRQLLSGSLAVGRGTLIAERWRTEKCLASGGYGDVWEGIDTQTQSRIAVKILRTNAGNNDPSAIARMRQEAEILAAIDHPSIVSVFDFGSSPYGHFLVMEMLDGHAIDQLLTVEGPIDPERAIPLVKQLLSALEVAHSKQIFHRDLKPENIIVVTNPDGTEVAKLVDFGIAKATRLLNDSEEGATLVQTRAGGFMGTPRYAAPEQAVGDPCGPNIDLFALGLVIAEWLTGKMRIDAERHGDVMQQLLSPEELDLSDVPYRFREWLGLMIRKNPRRRLQNARQALEHLEQLVVVLHAPSQILEQSQPMIPALPSKGGAQSAFAANDGPLELDYDRARKPQPLPPQSIGYPPGPASTPYASPAQIMPKVGQSTEFAIQREHRRSSTGYKVSRFMFAIAVGIISFAAFAVLILILAGLFNP